MACHRVQPVCGWNGSLSVFWMIQSCYPLKCKWTPCFSSDLNTEIQIENVWGKKEVLSPLLRVHGNFMILSFVQWLCRSIITSHWLGSTTARKSITQHHTVAVSYYSWGAESSLRSLTLPQTPPSPHHGSDRAPHTTKSTSWPESVSGLSLSSLDQCGPNPEHAAPLHTASVSKKSQSALYLYSRWTVEPKDASNLSRDPISPISLQDAAGCTLCIERHPSDRGNLRLHNRLPSIVCHVSGQIGGKAEAMRRRRGVAANTVEFNYILLLNCLCVVEVCLFLPDSAWASG